MNDNISIEFQTKINYQRVMLLYEVADMVTDTLKPVFVYFLYLSGQDILQLSPVDVYLIPSIANYTNYTYVTSTANFGANYTNFTNVTTGDEFCTIKTAAYLATDCDSLGEGQGSRLWLFVVCSAIALLAIYNAVTNVPRRWKVLMHLQSIVDGDALQTYATAMYGHQENGGTDSQNIDEDNLMLRLDKCVLDITMKDLNTKSFKMEDMPSLLVFVAEIIVYPKEIELISVVNAIVSAVLIGKKSNSQFRKKQLVADKRNIEEQIASLEKPIKRERSVREGSMTMVAAVLGREKANKIEDEHAGAITRMKSRRKSLASHNEEEVSERRASVVQAVHSGLELVG